jgi:hypothetical protein
MTRERQRLLKKKNNIAWRPDRVWEALELGGATQAQRQLQLDPNATEVDTYDEGKGPTGDQSENAQERHNCGRIRVSLHAGHPLLLIDDPPTANPRKTKEEKVLERGWGEVYFSSYRHILEQCEQKLNRPVLNGGWSKIVNVDPAVWGAVERPALTPLTEAELKQATAGCLFPVHAMGYNWLQPIGQSALDLAKRINGLIEKYKAMGLKCEQVIIITHSMGGLVGRALLHPKMGNIERKILGMVHGVLPATGAPAAYRRMRCGFEEGAFGLDPTPKILGNDGSEVTAVLGNSVGALQLLPSCAYGNGWLRVKHAGFVVESWPKDGDPYAEIYSVRDRWFGLLREEWLNPAQRENAGFGATCERLMSAKRFHQAIENIYHPQSYAHYGADANRPSWETVTWNYEQPVLAHGWREMRIQSDSGQGLLNLREPSIANEVPSGITARIGRAEGAGDQTVPVRSSDHQLLSGQFKGIFRQTGYEHQSSYSDQKALQATLFSIVKIAATMKWSE